MDINFDTKIDRHHTSCTKFDGLTTYYGKSDLLSLWIADMDFPVPQEVTDAIEQRVKHPVYGYNLITDAYLEAFIAWQKNHFNWTVAKPWLTHTPGVLSGLATAILAFTEPGDGILIQPPVYFPFRGTIEALGRKVINNPLVYENGRFSIDFKDLEQKASQAKLFILCSPHNPSGRVFDLEEMEQIAAICQANDLMVFSDEIHSDIVFHGKQHYPYANINDWTKDHCIVAMAPSKTFNIAGLEMSLMVIPNQEIRQRYQTYLRTGLHIGNPNACGLAAAQAAYEHGTQWYEALLVYLQENIDYLDQALKAQVPQVRLVYPESTYIPLLDVKALGMTMEETKVFFVEQVGAALNVGTTFGQEGDGFMRINVATQRENLVRFVAQLQKAVEAGVCSA